MPKCYHPRLIDLPPPKKPAAADVFSLAVQEEDGAPDVSNVQRIRFPNGMVTVNSPGDVSVNFVPGISGDYLNGMYLGELLGAHVGFFTRVADDGIHQRFTFEATDSTGTPKWSLEVDENGNVYLNGVAQ